MTALRDPDDLPPITEDRAAEWIAQSHDGGERDTPTPDTVRREVRGFLLAVADARFTGEDDTTIVQALNAYVTEVYRSSDKGPTVIAKALYDALWCGGRSVEEDARDGLVRLRDMQNVTPLLEGL